jgi:peptidyl-prolyl cis-trans isomerase D
VHKTYRSHMTYRSVENTRGYRCPEPTYLLPLTSLGATGVPTVPLPAVDCVPQAVQLPAPNMLETIRKRQRILLIVITTLTIISFVWFMNPTRTRGTPQAVIGKINGRSVTMEELQKVDRSAQIAYFLQLSDLLHQLAGADGSREQQRELFAWNILLIRDEAKRLQLDPSTEEIQNAERNLAAFQTDNQFDASKYQQIVELLRKNSMTAADLDNVVADQLRFQKISTLIRGSCPLPEALYRQTYEQQNQLLHCSFIRLNGADFAKDIVVSDQDVQNYYKEHAAQLQTPEKKKIEFVAFALTDEQKKLPDQEKQAALKTLAEQAEAFVQPLGDHPDQFDQVAREKGLQVQQTGFFESSKPDPLIMTLPEVVQQAQSLTKEQPLDEVQAKDGFYVIRLVEEQPSRPLTLEEAKDQIVTGIKKGKVQQAILTKGQQIRTQIEEAIKGGATFADAAQKAGLKVETAEPFAMMGKMDMKNPVFIALRINQAELQPGQISGVLFEGEDGLLVHLDKKDPIDENKYLTDKKAQYAAFNDFFAGQMFREWLRVATQRAGGSPITGFQGS